MTKRPHTTFKRILIFGLIAPVLAILISAGYSLLSHQVQIADAPSAPTSPKPEPKPRASAEPATPKANMLHGKTISIGDSFTTTVPNGWVASVSTQPSFLAIQFARPNKIATLNYNQTRKPKIGYDGIPSWGGLTEHFYIRDVSAANQIFNPSDHSEVTSDAFLFNDGTKGVRYSVTKHATEAQKWGGLQKDSKWYGRVYVYKKGSKTIEAHLAFYPSTDINTGFFEKVAKTISQ